MATLYLNNPIISPLIAVLVTVIQIATLQAKSRIDEIKALFKILTGQDPELTQ